jgi:hypothetical protein
MPVSGINFLDSCSFGLMDVVIKVFHLRSVNSNQ